MAQPPCDAAAGRGSMSLDGIDPVLVADQLAADERLIRADAIPERWLVSFRRRLFDNVGIDASTQTIMAQCIP
jgi:hypothetical protein